MRLTLSHELSTDKQQRAIETLNNSTLSDKSQKRKDFHYRYRNGPSRKFLIHCQFPDLLIDSCEKEWIETPLLHSMMQEIWSNGPFEMDYFLNQLAMGPRESFLSTRIEIEIDDVMVMTHGFYIFNSCLWMVLLTVDKKKIAQNASTLFFH